MNIEWLDWPCPANVKALYTYRHGGNRQSPYNSFNLGDHVGDDLHSVEANRQQLVSIIGGIKLNWLKQVHGTRVLDVSDIAMITNQEADASTAHTIGNACCIMTADCLPVFFCNGISKNNADRVALAHAGWRGLLQGVLQQTLEHFPDPTQTIAYLGPAISQPAFEVGGEVRDAFLKKYPYLSAYFDQVSVQNNKWLADLYGIARVLLLEAGVSQVYGGTRCTYLERDHFFSYRRDGATGRMAHVIWLTHID